jgi:hypothetical protein
MSKFHTTKVQGVEVLALPAADNGYRSITVTRDQAASLGHKTKRAGKELFGHVARHQIVRNGELAEYVTVFSCGSHSIIL